MGVTSIDLFNVQVEKIQPFIADLTLTEKTLDSVFEQQPSEMVGAISARVIFKTQKPGHYTIGSGTLDNQPLPTGGGNKYPKGAVTPVTLMLPTGWSKLADLINKKTADVSMVSLVSEFMEDAVTQLTNVRDILLQIDNLGTLAVVASVNTGTKTVTLNATPFGGRLLQSGQTVDCVDPATNIKRTGSWTIDSNSDFIGSTQTFAYLGADIAGATAGDLVRVQGLTDGAPVAFNGIKALISSSLVGTTMGINRPTNPFVIANGLDNGTAPITQPILRLMETQVKNRLGPSALKGQFWHTHPSQRASYEELGFQLLMIPLASGKAGALDLLFSGEMSVNGRPIVENVHASQTDWNFIQAKGFGKVKYADPFWYDTGTGKIFPIYDGTSGNPRTAYGAVLVDGRQYFCNNFPAQGVISNCGVPANN